MLLMGSVTTRETKMDKRDEDYTRSQAVARIADRTVLQQTT